MTDLLVRLYDLPVLQSEAQVRAAGVTIRRALAPERPVLLKWVEETFSPGWAGECAVALGHLPATMLVAVRGNTVLGFACYDATLRGFFGPTGVAEAARGGGIGEALLMATLRAMGEAGYGYAIIGGGGAGPIGFYQKRLEAIEIPGSRPGIYKGMLT